MESQNLADGISLAQTAEAGLQAISASMQRVRELAVQAANFTNTSADRVALQAEVSERLQEINRVVSQTAFNGIRLLDGSFSGASFQAGADVGAAIDFDGIADTRLSALGQTQTSAFSSTQAVSASTAATLKTVQIGTAPAVNLGNFVNDAKLLADAINTAGVTGLSANASPNVITGGNATGTTNNSNHSFTLNGVAFTVKGDQNGTTDRANMTAAINAISASTGVTAVDMGAGQGVQLTAADGRNISVSASNVAHLAYFGLGGLNNANGWAATISINYQNYSGSADNVVFTNTGMATQAFSPTVTTHSAASLTVGTVTAATTAIKTMDAALATVSASRSALGALMTRFERTIEAQ